MKVLSRWWHAIKDKQKDKRRKKHYTSQLPLEIALVCVSLDIKFIQETPYSHSGNVKDYCHFSDKNVILYIVLNLIYYLNTSNLYTIDNFYLFLTISLFPCPSCCHFQLLYCSKTLKLKSKIIILHNLSKPNLFWNVKNCWV